MQNNIIVLDEMFNTEVSGIYTPVVGELVQFKDMKGRACVHPPFESSHCNDCIMHGYDHCLEIACCDLERSDKLSIYLKHEE